MITWRPMSDFSPIQGRDPLKSYEESRVLSGITAANEMLSHGTEGPFDQFYLFGAYSTKQGFYAERTNGCFHLRSWSGGILYPENCGMTSVQGFDNAALYTNFFEDFFREEVKKRALSLAQGPNRISIFRLEDLNQMRKELAGRVPERGRRQLRITYPD